MQLFLDQIRASAAAKAAVYAARASLEGGVSESEHEESGSEEEEESEEEENEGTAIRVAPGWHSALSRYRETRRRCRARGRRLCAQVELGM